MDKSFAIKHVKTFFEIMIHGDSAKALLQCNADCSFVFP